MTPPALTGDGATYTVSLTDPSPLPRTLEELCGVEHQLLGLLDTAQELRVEARPVAAEHHLEVLLGKAQEPLCEVPHPGA